MINNCQTDVRLCHKKVKSLTKTSCSYFNKVHHEICVSAKFSAKLKYIDKISTHVKMKLATTVKQTVLTTITILIIFKRTALQLLNPPKQK